MNQNAAEKAESFQGHPQDTDRILAVFGETVIIRQDPQARTVNAAVIEEIVPPGVGAPLHRHSREDEICLHHRGPLPHLTRR